MFLVIKLCLLTLMTVIFFQAAASETNYERVCAQLSGTYYWTDLVGQGRMQNCVFQGEVKSLTNLESSLQSVCKEKVSSSVEIIAGKASLSLDCNVFYGLQ